MEKQWDGDGVPLDQSNCAGIGSDEDKAARKAAAEAEPAWEGAGTSPGKQIWRVEAFKLVPWPEEEYGRFYKGDSYIILNTEETDSGKFSYQIFFWLGERTSTDEMGTAAYKTVELDDLLDGEPTQHREVMGMESQGFKALFPTVSYLEGGVESGFNSAAPDTYQPKLLQIRKTERHGVVRKEVTLSRESLNEGDCFVLDAGTSIYVWTGSAASAFEKYEANAAAENIENGRGGQATVLHDPDSTFWDLLGGEGEIKSAEEGSDRPPEPELGEGILYKLSDTTGSLALEEVGRGELTSSMLSSDDVMMLDRGVEVCLWVGAGASAVEWRNAYRTALGFLKTNDRDVKIPIHLFKEGQTIKDPAWKSIFAD